MCNNREMLLRDEIGRLTGSELHAAEGVPFRIDMIKGDEILLTRATGTDGKFQLNHLVPCTTIWQLLGIA